MKLSGARMILLIIYSLTVNISAYLNNIRIVDLHTTSESIRNILNTIDPSKLGLDSIQYIAPSHSNNIHIEKNSWKLDDLQKAYIWSVEYITHNDENNRGFSLEWVDESLPKNKQIPQGILLGLLENSTDEHYKYDLNLRRMVIHPNVYLENNNELTAHNLTISLLNEVYTIAQKMNSRVITKNLNKRTLVEIAYLRN